jgi:hypothetical protein
MSRRVDDLEIHPARPSGRTVTVSRPQ